MLGWISLSRAFSLLLGFSKATCSGIFIEETLINVAALDYPIGKML
jgi:hypothetical protein